MQPTAPKMHQANENVYIPSAFDFILKATAERRDVKSFFAGVHNYLKKCNQKNIDGKTEENWVWWRNVTEGLNDRPAELNAILIDRAVPFLLKRMHNPLETPQGFDAFVLNSLPAVDPFLPIKLRHQIGNFLRVVNSLLERFKMTDETTELITLWHMEFAKKLMLNEKSVIETYQEYVSQLYEILRDPLGMPFDSNAVLGNDGNTYGTIGLTLILSRIDEKVRHKHPLNPENNTDFYTQSHPIARFLFKWLEMQHGVMPITIKLKKTYDELIVSGKAPRIPTIRTIELKRMQEQQKQREDELLQFAKELEQIPEAKEAEEKLKLAQEEFVAFKVVNKASIDAWDQKWKGVFNEVRDDIKQMKHDGEVFQGENQQVGKQLKQAKKQVEQLKHDVNNLGNSTRNVCEALKKRDQDRKKSNIISGAICGLCIIGSLLCPPGSAFVPWNNGIQFMAII